ncbi:MAG: ISNCY family transposase, partial [Planctomycetales bacterium]
MRKAFDTQRRLDCQAVLNVSLNFKCRDELIPVLRGLQYLYSQPQLRDGILELVAQDVNNRTRPDRGREGLDYWCVTVLAAVRLGCDLNYDKLQDLAEHHRALRQIMGIGDCQEDRDFNARRIRDNLCLLQPATIEAISHRVVDEAYRLKPDAVKKQRADSFVVETNIHYPTESSLIVDGVRKTMELCVEASQVHGLTKWRQHAYLLKKVKRTARQIARVSARKGADYNKRLATQNRKLLRRAEGICAQAVETCETLKNEYELDFAWEIHVAEIKVFVERARHVCDTARRRVLQGEKVPNQDKLFSIFEPHTQLYRRGKASKPTQFGRLVFICEDAAGFISHHCVLPRDERDQDVAIKQTRLLQKRFDHRIEEISFDRGFHSPENQAELAEIVEHVCLPKPGKKQAAEQEAEASVKFHESRQRHPGVESAIGALQSGNGLARCRDASEVGFERYVALAVLGRNLHALGKLLIAEEDE